jgi:hypothetical protein
MYLFSIDRLNGSLCTFFRLLRPQLKLSSVFRGTYVTDDVKIFEAWRNYSSLQLDEVFLFDLAAGFSGYVSACHRGDWSYGSWDRIPPGYWLVIFYNKKEFFSLFPKWSALVTMHNLLLQIAELQTLIRDVETTRWTKPFSLPSLPDHISTI